MICVKKESILFFLLLMLLNYCVSAQTWEEIGFNLPAGNSVSSNTDITFANKDVGWMFTYYNGLSKLYKTTNGGTSWKTMKGFDGLEYAVSYSLEPDFFYMINGNYGTSVGYPARFTTDGGITWDSTQILDKNFYALYFFSKEKGIAISDSYSWITTDGGLTWNKGGQIVLPSDIHFYNEKIGWAVGYGPTGNDVSYISETTDGGNTWKYIDRPFPVLSGITFIDSLKGFVVGAKLNAAYFQTTDGGKNWQMDTTFKIGGFDIEFLDDKNGWISGWGQILKTSDGGETWENQLHNLINYRLIKLIVLKKDKTAYILGVNSDSNTATLLKADLSNITSVKENKKVKPNKFYLYQNYPNPFNPSTLIRYQISEFSHITLKVFDMLGREIAILVNENKLQGSYSIQFSSDKYHLPSGVYIAKLTAGNFMATLKMILQK